jgi:hypothetical protein
MYFLLISVRVAVTYVYLYIYMRLEKRDGVLEVKITQRGGGR